MTNALLAILVLEFAILICVYAIPEKRSATHYRDKHLQHDDDSLVYSDLLTRVVMRNGRYTVLAGSRAQESSADDKDAERPANGSHSSSFLGWDKP